MASAAEQLAANLNFGAFAKAEALKKRIWFTLGALLVYRLGTYIPVPGINPDALAKAFNTQQSGILGMFNMFAGGAVGRMAIFALGVMPYISASIIMQLMTSVVPALEALKKEGEQGRKVINQYTRYGTVLLAALQAYGIGIGLEGASKHRRLARSVLPHHHDDHADRRHHVPDVAGRADHRAWHRQRPVADHLLRHRRQPAARHHRHPRARPRGRAVTGPHPRRWHRRPFCVVAFIVFVERAQRRLLIQYPKRQVGNRMFQGEASHLPLKLNTSGVIPPIFASSLLLLPVTVAELHRRQRAGLAADDHRARSAAASRSTSSSMAALIVFFAFFYTAVVFNPTDTADNLKKHGGFIPGIRPGKNTADYIDYVLTRITVLGAIYLVLVCLLPQMLIDYTGVPFYFGGTSLLIVVSVTLDTVAQIQGHLLAHQYEGLVKRRRSRGRRDEADAARAAGRGQGDPGRAARQAARHRRSFRPATCCAPPSPPAPTSASAPRRSWIAAISCPTTS